MNSGERIDYILYPCQLSMIASSLFLAAPISGPGSDFILTLVIIAH